MTSTKRRSKSEPEPNDDQRAAVDRFLAAHPKDAWDAMTRCWMTGAYAREGVPETDHHLLQQVRNQLGPRWFAKYLSRAMGRKVDTSKLADGARGGYLPSVSPTGQRIAHYCILGDDGDWTHYRETARNGRARVPDGETLYPTESAALKAAARRWKQTRGA